jgi:hypothetical protein
MKRFILQISQERISVTVGRYFTLDYPMMFEVIKAKVAKGQPQSMSLLCVVDDWIDIQLLHHPHTIPTCRYSRNQLITLIQ